MSNNPPNDRRGQRPSPASLSLGQLGRDDEPLLLPIPPSSSIEDIIRLMREAGSPRIELLVPDGTAALQTIAGNQMLRNAAAQAKIQLTIFTADEKTAQAAGLARIDVMSIGGKVAAPRPGDTPRRPTGQHRAITPSQPPVTPRPAQPTGQQAQPQAPSQRSQSGATPSQQPARESTQQVRRQAPGSAAAPRGATPAAGMPAAADDQDFLSRLEAFDHSGAPAGQQAGPRRIQESDEGALLFDVPGDIGVPRPADNDAEWATFVQQPQRPAQPRKQPQPDVLADFPDPGPNAQRRGQRGSLFDQQQERPSMLSALFGFLPSRARRAQPAQAADTAVVDDENARMPRPERSVEETDARRRQARTMLIWPLIGAGFLLGALLLFMVLNGSWSQLLNRNSELVVEPPLSASDALTLTNQIVPLVREPVTAANSLNVQGVLISDTATVTRQASAAGKTLAPIGFASGTLLISNPSSQPITVPQGTLVLGGGQEYTIDTTVTVPPAVSDFSGTRNGQAEATVTAKVAGAQGNIPADTIELIQGYSGSQGPLRIRQAAPFEGGTDQEVAVVSPDDVNAILPDVLSQLYAQGVQKIQAQVNQLPGYALVASDSTPEISPTQELLRQIDPSSFEVFPPIGQVIAPEMNGTFTLKMSRRFEALASPVDQAIDEQLRRAIASLANAQGRNVQPSDVTITGWRRSDTGLAVDATITPRSGYASVPSEREQEIEAMLRGKSRAEAEQILQTLRDEGQIGNFSLPESWATVPENLDIVFQAPTGGQSNP